ncbi:MAG: tetratricopeptide repeat protein, partial [bacterium]
LLLKALEKFPNSSELYSNLGVTLINSGSEKEGIDYFIRAKSLDEPTQSVFNNLGAYYLKKKQYKEALKEFNKARKFEQKNATLLVNIGFCLHKLKDFKNAKKIFNRALEIAPKNILAKELLATIYEQENNYEIAVELFSDLISQEGAQENYLFTLGDILIKMGERERGISIYEEAVKQNPDDPGYLLQLIERYLAIEYYDIAILKLQKLIERSPKNLKAFSLLGEAYYLQGLKNPLRTADAMDKSLYYFKNILSINDLDIKANYHAGLIYYTYKKDKNTGMEYWQKLLKIENVPDQTKNEILGRIKE